MEIRLFLSAGLVKEAGNKSFCSWMVDFSSVQGKMLLICYLVHFLPKNNFMILEKLYEPSFI